MSSGTEEKSVTFEVAETQSGGGSRRRRTRKSVIKNHNDIENQSKKNESEIKEEGEGEGKRQITIEKIKPVELSKQKPEGPPPPVVIAPPKKRPPKLLLVSGGNNLKKSRALQQSKTFKAHRIKILIDNTARTQKRRRQTLQAIDAMTDEQLRNAAVSAKLSKTETVAKVPKELLRQMLKDYRIMRGMLV